jgi:hypothetical protein
MKNQSKKKQNPSRTDWKKVKMMRDEDIIYDEDCPETDEEFWSTGEIHIYLNGKKNKHIENKIIK